MKFRRRGTPRQPGQTPFGVGVLYGYGGGVYVFCAACHATVRRWGAPVEPSDFFFDGGGRRRTDSDHHSLGRSRESCKARMRRLGARDDSRLRNAKGRCGSSRFTVAFRLEGPPHQVDIRRQGSALHAAPSVFDAFVQLPGEQPPNVSRLDDLLTQEVAMGAWRDPELAPRGVEVGQKAGGVEALIPIGAPAYVLNLDRDPLTGRVLVPEQKPDRPCGRRCVSGLRRSPRLVTTPSSRNQTSSRLVADRSMNVHGEGGCWQGSPPLSVPGAGGGSRCPAARCPTRRSARRTPARRSPKTTTVVCPV